MKWKDVKIWLFSRYDLTCGVQIVTFVNFSAAELVPLNLERLITEYKYIYDNVRIEWGVQNKQPASRSCLVTNWGHVVSTRPSHWSIITQTADRPRAPFSANSRVISSGHYDMRCTALLELQCVRNEAKITEIWCTESAFFLRCECMLDVGVESSSACTSCTALSESYTSLGDQL